MLRTNNLTQQDAQAICDTCYETRFELPEGMWEAIADAQSLKGERFIEAVENACADYGWGYTE
jgi:hypothetical protein